MGEKLLPCPFCGAESTGDTKGRGPWPFDYQDSDERPDNRTWAVFCWTCGIDGKRAESQAEAIAAWNTRAPTLHASLAEARARIAALEAGLRDIADKAPKEEPETYEGDNHGDSYSNGWKRARYFDAQIARTLLDANAREGEL